MIQAAGDIGTRWIFYLCNGIMKEGCIPENWKSSVVLPIYKGKGDSMECGSYRRIKLLEHAMKVVERIFEHRIRQQVEIDDMQFGFMKGNGTTVAIFTVRALLSQYMPWSCVCPSLCVSVSVTSRFSTKLAKRRNTQTTPHDSQGL